MKLPPTRTPFAPADLITALRAAYVAQLGHDGSAGTLAILCAQVALETANGASCVQWNVGNFKAGAGVVDSCDFLTVEYQGTVPVKQVCSFAAFASLEAGVEYYLRALYTSWPEAWAAAVKGDVPGFASGLRARGYYTAPEQLYAAGVQRWDGYYLEHLAGVPPPTEPAPVDGLLLGALATEGLLDA